MTAYFNYTSDEVGRANSAVRLDAEHLLSVEMPWIVNAIIFGYFGIL